MGAQFQKSTGIYKAKGNMSVKHITIISLHFATLL